MRLACKKFTEGNDVERKREGAGGGRELSDCNAGLTPVKGRRSVG